MSTNPVTGRSIVILPKRHDYVVKVTLSDEEMRLYKLKSESETSIYVRILRQRQGMSYSCAFVALMLIPDVSKHAVVMHGSLVKASLYFDAPEDASEEEDPDYEDVTSE